MHFSTSFILAALPFIVTARVPVKARQSNAAFTLLSIHSGDEVVHNQPIVASDDNFYIGVNTTTPTQIILDDAGAALNVEVPGGQEIFVNNTGALAYTSPHSHALPSGAQTGPFEKSGPSAAGDSIDNLVFSGLSSSGWLACPDVANSVVVYQIFANFTGVQVSGTSITHCHDIAIALEPANASAAPTEIS